VSGPRFTDADGDELTFLSEGDGSVLLRHTGAGVCIAPADFPVIAACLYQAAGLPAPVILDRPEHPRASLVFEGVTFTIRPGSGVDATRVHGGIQTGTLYEPDVLRRVAADLAALADEAESDPDPAEVEELTRAIIQGTPDWHSASGPAAGEIARAVLRAGWKREQRDG